MAPTGSLQFTDPETFKAWLVSRLGDSETARATSLEGSSTCSCTAGRLADEFAEWPGKLLLTGDRLHFICDSYNADSLVHTCELSLDRVTTVGFNTAGGTLSVEYDETPTAKLYIFKIRGWGWVGQKNDLYRCVTALHAMGRSVERCTADGSLTNSLHAEMVDRLGGTDTSDEALVGFPCVLPSMYFRGCPPEEVGLDVWERFLASHPKWLKAKITRVRNRHEVACTLQYPEESMAVVLYVNVVLVFPTSQESQHVPGHVLTELAIADARDPSRAKTDGEGNGSTSHRPSRLGEEPTREREQVRVSYSGK